MPFWFDPWEKKVHHVGNADEISQKKKAQYQKMMKKLKQLKHTTKINIRMLTYLEKNAKKPQKQHT